jgi:hypothetical protein
VRPDEASQLFIPRSVAGWGCHKIVKVKIAQVVQKREVGVGGWRGGGGVDLTQLLGARRRGTSTFHYRVDTLLGFPAVYPRFLTCMLL